MNGTRTLGGLCLAVLAAALAVGPAPARPDPPPQPAATPWGVSSSASAIRNHAEWVPKVTAAGVADLRKVLPGCPVIR